MAAPPSASNWAKWRPEYKEHLEDKKIRRFADRLGGRFLRTTTDSDLPFLYIHFVLPYTVVTVLSRPRFTGYDL